VFLFYFNTAFWLLHFADMTFDRLLRAILLKNLNRNFGQITQTGALSGVFL
jgi:hypothetical protein